MADHIEKVLTPCCCVVVSLLGSSLFIIALWSTTFVCVMGNVCVAENVGSEKNCSLSEVSSDDPVVKYKQEYIINNRVLLAIVDNQMNAKPSRGFHDPTF